MSDLTPIPHQAGYFEHTNHGFSVKPDEITPQMISKKFSGYQRSLLIHFFQKLRKHGDWAGITLVKICEGLTDITRLKMATALDDLETEQLRTVETDRGRVCFATAKLIEDLTS